MTLKQKAKQQITKYVENAYVVVNVVEQTCTPNKKSQQRYISVNDTDIAHTAVFNFFLHIINHDN